MQANYTARWKPPYQNHMDIVNTCSWTTKSNPQMKQADYPKRESFCLRRLKRPHILDINDINPEETGYPDKQVGVVRQHWLL